MRRIWYLAGINSLLFSFPSCSTPDDSKSDREDATIAAVKESADQITVSEDIEAKTIEGDNFSAQIIGDELILDLKSNATTGHTWVITKEPEQFTSDYDVYVEPENTNGMVGAGGITEFHIIALQEGTGTMVFQYRRNWEGGEIAGTYALTLEITNDLQITNASFEPVT